MNDSDLQYMREERQRAMNPSAYDRGFEEGNTNMANGWDNDTDWSSGGSGTDIWDSTPAGGTDLWSQPTGGGGGETDMWGSSAPSMNGNFNAGPFDGGSFSNQYQTPFTPMGPQMPTPAQQNASGDDFEDKVFNGVINGSKTVVNAVKESGKAAKTFGVYNARGMGKQLIITGGLCVLLGILACVLSNSLWVHYITAGIVSMGIGSTIMMIAQGRIEELGLPNVAPTDTFNAVEQQAQLPDANAANNTMNMPQDNSSWGDWGSTPNNGMDNMSNPDTMNMGDWQSDNTANESNSDDDEWPSWATNENDTDDDMADSGVVDIEEDEDEGKKNAETEDEPEEEVDVQALVSNINVPHGVMTRQFIYERVTKVFKHITKNYASIEVLDEDSNEFGMWLGYLNEAVDSLKAGADSKEARPILVSVKKKLFYYMLEINNKGVKGIKMDALISELVSLYAYDRETNKLNPAVYGSGNSSGSIFYIKIMRGESVSVSVEDILVSRSDFFLDTKNEMPCALGLDIDGDPVLVDLVDVNALLITGEPRSGKSWALRNIMIQLMMFGSPRDVCFYICDPKDSISDYVRFKAPHIRRFESGDDAILETLRELVKVEGPRRKQVLSEAGCYKIQEYRDLHPNADFPYIYVLIDEIVTLSERMSKETKQEFQGLLMELVTQFPATGLRLVLVPHIVKDDIIKKSISQNMPCRISVRGNTEHIELCTGMKCGTGEGKFPYKLAKVGDMAVNLKAGNDVLQTFVHSAVVGATSEASDAAFDFVDALWRGIEGIAPDEELRITKSASIGKNNSAVGVPIQANMSTNSVMTNNVNTNNVGAISNPFNNSQQAQGGFTYRVENNVANNMPENTVVDNTQVADNSVEFNDFVDVDENIW